MSAPIMSDQFLEGQIDAYRLRGEAICAEISRQICHLLPDQSLALPIYDQARFSLITDPYSQQQDLIADWLSEGRRRGQIRLHHDGSFYAEYDVLQAHPRRPAIFIEAVHAWGREDVIKSEARLIDMPQDSI